MCREPGNLIGHAHATIASIIYGRSFGIFTSFSMPTLDKTIIEEGKLRKPTMLVNSHKSKGVIHAQSLHRNLPSAEPSANGLVKDLNQPFAKCERLGHFQNALFPPSLFWGKNLTDLQEIAGPRMAFLSM